MLYLGCFYADEINENESNEREASFQLIVEADSIEEADKAFQKKLKTCKDDALSDIKEIYCDTIFEIGKVAKTPVLINFQTTTKPESSSSISRAVPKQMKGSEINSYMLMPEETNPDGSHEVEVYVTRKLNK